MMVYLLIDALIAILYLSLAAVSLVNGGYKHSKNRLFAFMSFSLLAWLVANHVSNDTANTQEVAIYANYVIFAASFVTTLLLTKLTVMIADDQKVAKMFAKAEPLLWIVAILSATPLVGHGVEIQGSVYAVVFGPGVGVYALGLIGMIVLMGLVIIRGWNQQDVHKKQQIRTIGMGLALTAPSVLLLGFLIPYFTNDFTITQVALAPLSILALAIFHGIVRHGLFSVRMTAVRTLTYALSLGAMTSIYFGLAYIVSIAFLQNTANPWVDISPINILLALALVSVFQPIKQFFDRATNKLFFRDGYDTNDFIARLGAILTSTTHLRTLLERTSEELKSVFKASHAVFTVYREEKADAVIGAGHFPRFTANELDHIRTLVDSTEDKILVIEEIIDSTSLDQNQVRIVNILHRRHVALIAPLHGNVGYLMMGDALSGGYTRRDVKTLDTISDELVIAIQNARSVQEVRELNTHLQQRIDHATQELRKTNEKLRKLDETKDEFISMASHQLRTPLTSIKGYLSMVLEGDMGEVNVPQQKVLSEAFTSSERMVRLISDFLNVSRLQTGKFVIDAHPTNLAKIVDEEVEAISRLAESHNMTLVYKRPKKFPVLNVDEDKLRQVIMNFIDNAIYYSRPKSTIVIKLHVEHGDVVVEVHDHGIGVPKDQQEKLFTKFFRAENARRQRPDGTGVGLFLARKVVTAHGGEIIFSSHEGRGSVFGFRLPMKKLEIKAKK